MGVASRTSFLTIAVSFFLAGAAQGQRTGDGFMFRRPIGSVTVRGGFERANAGSDLFTFTTSQLTLDRRDFSGGSLGGDIAIQATPRLDVFIGGSWTSRETSSEFRDWVDQADRPIKQVTLFTRVPVTAGARFYLLPRGRSIGRFAWIPARFTAYLGAAAGVTWYEFRQRGDFIDFNSLDVFADKFDSRGLAPAAQGLGGMELAILPRFSLNLEARYTLARARLDRDFSGFDPIDLSGPSATLGIVARY